MAERGGGGGEREEKRDNKVEERKEWRTEMSKREDRKNTAFCLLINTQRISSSILLDDRRSFRVLLADSSVEGLTEGR